MRGTRLTRESISSGIRRQRADNPDALIFIDPDQIRRREKSSNRKCVLSVYREETLTKTAQDHFMSITLPRNTTGTLALTQPPLDTMTMGRHCPRRETARHPSATAPTPSQSVTAEFAMSHIPRPKAVPLKVVPPTVVPPTAGKSPTPRRGRSHNPSPNQSATAEFVISHIPLPTAARPTAVSPTVVRPMAGKSPTPRGDRSHNPSPNQSVTAGFVISHIPPPTAARPTAGKSPTPSKPEPSH